MLTTLFAAWAAQCDSASINGAFSAAENAYLAGESKNLRQQVSLLARATDCAGVTPEDARKRHLANALEHAMANDWQAAEVDLGAAVAAMPLAPLDGVVGQDPRLRLAYYRAQERGVDWTAAPVARRNGLLVGLEPGNLPVLTSRSRGRMAPVLRWSGVALGAAALGMYGGALASRAAYDRVKGGSRAEVLPRYRATNLLSIGSGVAGVAGAGLFTVSFVVD